jgi:hypothetical protein
MVYRICEKVLKKKELEERKETSGSVDKKKERERIL